MSNIYTRIKSIRHTSLITLCRFRLFVNYRQLFLLFKNPYILLFRTLNIEYLKKKILPRRYHLCVMLLNVIGCFGLLKIMALLLIKSFIQEIFRNALSKYSFDQLFSLIKEEIFTLFDWIFLHLLRNRVLIKIFKETFHKIV